MNSEVVNLSRNVVIQGDENTEDNSYGVHIKATGNWDYNLQIRVSNVEILKTG